MSVNNIGSGPAYSAQDSAATSLESYSNSLLSIVKKLQKESEDLKLRGEIVQVVIRNIGSQSEQG